MFRNENLPLTSCSNEKDILGWYVLGYAWNFERCLADWNKTKMPSTYFL